MFVSYCNLLYYSFEIIQNLQLSENTFLKLTMFIFSNTKINASVTSYFLQNIFNFIK